MAELKKRPSFNELFDAKMADAGYNADSGSFAAPVAGTQAKESSQPTADSAQVAAPAANADLNQLAQSVIELGAEPKKELPQEPEPVQAPSTEATPPAPVVQKDDTLEDLEKFSLELGGRSLNLNDLPEDQRPLVVDYVKNLKKGWTQKTTKVAEERKVLDKEKSDIKKQRDEVENAASWLQQNKPVIEAALNLWTATSGGQIPVGQQAAKLRTEEETVDAYLKDVGVVIDEFTPEIDKNNWRAMARANLRLQIETKDERTKRETEANARLAQQHAAGVKAYTQEYAALREKYTLPEGADNKILGELVFRKNEANRLGQKHPTMESVVQEYVKLQALETDAGFNSFVEKDPRFVALKQKIEREAMTKVVAAKNSAVPVPSGSAPSTGGNPSAKPGAPTKGRFRNFEEAAAAALEDLSMKQRAQAKI